MAKKKPAVFATDKDGRLYVMAKAVMSPLIPLIDGLSLNFFGRSGVGWLKVDDAIDWCRKEMQYHDADKYRVMIAVMEKAKRQEAERATAPGTPPGPP
jgi:hypothetical protein